MTEVTIRGATADDVSGIQRVAERGWNAAYGDLLAQETIDAAIDTWYGAETTQMRIEREDGAYLVAVADDEVVGYVSGDTAADVAVLGAIYVIPDRWSEGIGTMLLETFERICRECDCAVVELEVLAGNKRAESFYRTHEYCQTGQRETELFGETISERAFRKRID